MFELPHRPWRALDGWSSTERRQLEVEDARQVQELKVIARLDRHHLLIDVVLVGAVGDVVIDPRACSWGRSRDLPASENSRVGPVEGILVDLRAGVDNGLRPRW